MELSLIRNGAAEICQIGREEMYLVYEGEYRNGDIIRFVPDGKGFYVLELGLGKNILFSDGSPFFFPVPFGEKKIPYPENSFIGERHYLYARKAFDFETGYRNISENIYDHSGNVSLYPHSRANIETRGESVFASRNAFDGIVASSSHGFWPYGSWGINRDPNAELYLDFGRSVTIDRIVFYTRADFPHDAWWEKATVSFSDGTSEVFALRKKDGAQSFTLDERTVTSLTVKNLVKSDDPSPFPALRQLQVFGR